MNLDLGTWELGNLGLDESGIYKVRRKGRRKDGEIGLDAISFFFSKRQRRDREKVASTGLQLHLAFVEALRGLLLSF